MLFPPLRASPTKGFPVDSMISVVLPVHNCQDRLIARVENLLELLPDISPSFELLIVPMGLWPVNSNDKWLYGKTFRSQI